MTEITRDEWLTAIKDAQVLPRPEPDVFTMQELAGLLGMGRQAATQRVRLLVTAGKVEQTVKVIRASDGRLRTVTAYRLLKP